MMRDEALSKLIENAVANLSTQPIRISTRKGIVTLEGVVPSFRRKLAVQEIVESYDGCRGVINQLAVVPEESLPDPEIAEYVRSALEASADVPDTVIVVSVTNGVVTLSGHVANPGDRLAAEDVASGVRGVQMVENLLTIDWISKIGEEALASKIMEEMQSVHGLRDSGVRVAVTGGMAVLSGTADSLWQSRMAEKVVQRFALRVTRNEIQVKEV